MSVSLMIYWPDGSVEEVAIASYRGAQMWSAIGKEHSLQLVSLFNKVIPLDMENIQELANELTKIHRIFSGSDSADKEKRITSERLLEAIDRLKSSKGWEASIG